MAESYGLGMNHPTPAQVEETEREARSRRLDAQHDRLRELKEAADVAYFGPFKAGDTVSINGSVPLHVIEVTSAGVRGTSVTEQPFWFPRGAIKVVSGSVGAVARPSNVDNRVVEDSTMGDESLPMRPPPVQPGGEATFR